MFGPMLKSLLAPAPAPLPEADARTALAALLVRVARADGAMSEREATHIDRILAARYRLGPFAASELRQQAEVLETEAPDTVRFTRALKDAIPYEDRQSLVQSLWAIAVADGVRDPDEDALLRLVASLLGVSDRDSALARQRAERP